MRQRLRDDELRMEIKKYRTQTEISREYGHAIFALKLPVFKLFTCKRRATTTDGHGS
jgi:hypothetical protein